MAPLPVGQGSKEPARGGVLGVSSATSFFLEFPLLIDTYPAAAARRSGRTCRMSTLLGAWVLVNAKALGPQEGS